MCEGCARLLSGIVESWRENTDIGVCEQEDKEMDRKATEVGKGKWGGSNEF